MSAKKNRNISFAIILITSAIIATMACSPSTSNKDLSGLWEMKKLGLKADGKQAPDMDDIHGDYWEFSENGTIEKFTTDSIVPKESFRLKNKSIVKAQSNEIIYDIIELDKSRLILEETELESGKEYTYTYYFDKSELKSSEEVLQFSSRPIAISNTCATQCDYVRSQEYYNLSSGQKLAHIKVVAEYIRQRGFTDDDRMTVLENRLTEAIRYNNKEIATAALEGYIAWCDESKQLIGQARSIQELDPLMQYAHKYYCTNAVAWNNLLQEIKACKDLTQCNRKIAMALQNLNKVSDSWKIHLDELKKVNEKFSLPNVNRYGIPIEK